jgi:U3 small nucleolar RNA-associated protein 10
MRVWCGPYPTLLRATALEMAKRRLKQEDCAEVDFQAMIPYCIAALSDPAKKVRRSAADLLVVLGTLHPDASTEPSRKAQWASTQLYDDERDGLKWMTPQATRALLHTVLIPALEESILHEEHVSNVLRNHIESSSKASTSGPEKDSSAHLSSPIRLSIFTFLSSHVILTPLLTVKLRLLKPLNQVKSVSSTSRTQLLLPLLNWWTKLPLAEALQFCNHERLPQAQFDAACVDIVIPSDKDGMECLSKLLRNPQLQDRDFLIETVFAWPGTGFLLNAAIFQRDLPLLQGTILVLALFFVFLNLLVDVVQSAIDPRVQRA